VPIRAAEKAGGAADALANEAVASGITPTVGAIAGVGSTISAGTSAAVGSMTSALGATPEGAAGDALAPVERGETSVTAAAASAIGNGCTGAAAGATASDAEPRSMERVGAESSRVPASSMRRGGPIRGEGRGLPTGSGDDVTLSA
jgi:hypothetical protein